MWRILKSINQPFNKLKFLKSVVSFWNETIRSWLIKKDINLENFFENTEILTDQMIICLNYHIQILNLKSQRLLCH